MKHLGRVIGVLLIVAVPAVGVWLLVNKSAGPVPPPFVPTPLASAGVFVVAFHVPWKVIAPPEAATQLGDAAPLVCRI